MSLVVDVESSVREIKQRISQAQSAKARAEIERDTAQASADKARARLKDEFGVETPSDAQGVMASLEADLNRAIEDARNALERTA